MGVTDIDCIVAATADQSDSAAFRSVEAALRFAYGQRHRGEPDSLARHQKRETRGAPMFEDAEERAAWAGAIRRRLETLSPARRSVLVVRFAPRALPCSCRRPCCSGWAKNAEWTEACADLVELCIEAVAGQLANRQLRAGIVRKWSGERVNLGILAERCDVHRNPAGKQAKLIRKWLDRLEHQALKEADQCLVGASN